MAAWIPLAKAVLPYLTSIAQTAIPAFASRKEHAKSLDQHSEQISELQAAAKESAISMKTLVEQFETTVKAIDDGAGTIEARFSELAAQVQRARVFAVVSLLIAFVAICVAAFALLR